MSQKLNCLLKEILNVHTFVVVEEEVVVAEEDVMMIVTEEAAEAAMIAMIVAAAEDGMIAEVADETEATLATEIVTAGDAAGPTLARKEVVIVAAVTLEDVDEAEVRTEASPAAEVKRHHEKFNSIHNTWVHYVLLTHLILYCIK